MNDSAIARAVGLDCLNLVHGKVISHILEDLYNLASPLVLGIDVHIYIYLCSTAILRSLCICYKIMITAHTHVIQLMIVHVGIFSNLTRISALLPSSYRTLPSCLVFQPRPRYIHTRSDLLSRVQTKTVLTI